jgi:outer membrane scaffolding protein for murein synthesis (MipA/OmpV family)
MDRGVITKSWLAAALVAICSLAAAPAPAVEWSAGGAVAVFPDYDGSDDYRVFPAPIVLARNLYNPNTFVLWRANELTSNLLPDNHFRLGPYAEFIPVRIRVHDNKVDEMRDNGETALMLGANIGYDFDVAGQRGQGNLQQLGLHAYPRYDVLEGNGALVTFGPVYKGAFERGQWLVEGRLTGTWASDDYMENAFGVTGSDARRTGLDQFTAGSGFKDLGLFIQATHRITDRWSLTGVARYSRLFSDAEDSPIVEDRGSANQFLGALGAVYRF